MKKHVVVFILPAILMIVIAVSGWHYVTQEQEQSLSNEALQREIKLSAELVDRELVVTWQWPQMPEEGIYGTDYIGIAFETETAITEGKVILPLEEERVLTGTQVDNGVIFSYPTEMMEHEIVGAKGEVRQVLPDDVDASNIQITMLHTWTNHEDLQLENALFSNPRFGKAKAVQHWVKKMPLNKLLKSQR